MSGDPLKAAHALAILESHMRGTPITSHPTASHRPEGTQCSPPPPVSETTSTTCANKP